MGCPNLCCTVSLAIRRQRERSTRIETRKLHVAVQASRTLLCLPKSFVCTLIGIHFVYTPGSQGLWKYKLFTKTSVAQIQIIYSKYSKRFAQHRAWRAGRSANLPASLLPYSPYIFYLQYKVQSNLLSPSALTSLNIRNSTPAFSGLPPAGMPPPRQRTSLLPKVPRTIHNLSP